MNTTKIDSLNAENIATNTESGISRKILFVDDEKLLLEGIKRQFRRDFELTIADNAQDALSIIAEHGPFAVVVSDYNMPNTDGIVFLNKVYANYPETVLIMLTGRAELDVAINALHSAHISRFLNKPCPKEILTETLNDGLEQYRLRRSEHILQTQLQIANQQLSQLNSVLEQRVAEKTRALQLQYHYATLMTQVTNSADIIDNLINACRSLIIDAEIRLWLKPLETETFAPIYPSPNQLPTFSEQNCPVGIIKQLLDQNQTFTTGKLFVEDFDVTLLGDVPLLAVSLNDQHEVLGILTLAGKTPLDEVVIAAITGMATVTATALKSQWLREAQDQAQDAIITALAKLSEYRDPETGAHLERLKKYCQLLCDYLSTLPHYQAIVTPAFSKDLVRSSPLHDIGKVGIVDAILKKPGKLTTEEFEIMKTHAAIGGDTLRTVYEKYPSQNFIKCGMDIAYGHHEKWDGSGYPLGLQGEAIPLVARILALADVYDALTCRRVYKPPFPREKAKEIILAGKGNHFDPELVDIFSLLEADFYKISEEYADLITETDSTTH